jgi:cytoskeletal protein RodZ
MNQRLVVLIAVGLAALAVLLAACGPATPSPAAVSTDTPQAATVPPTATNVPVAATPTVAQDAAAATTVAEASPAATEAFPTPNPNPQCTAVPITADPNIKPVAADEWSKGPADAAITVIEYGDFQ